MADKVSMEYAAVQSFLSQLEEHRSSHTTSYNNARGEITARIAGYIGEGGGGSQNLLPVLDDHHTSVSNILNACHEVLTQHQTNNVGGDTQQSEAIKKAHNIAASSITSGLS
jgi:uncharacterized protein YukE